MSLLDRLKRHRSVDEIHSEGLSTAIETVTQFDQRTFRVKGQGIRASRVPYEEVFRFLRDEFPDYYTYTAKTQMYEDRHGIRHTRIEIKGWIGFSRQMNRYNPLDITCTIQTEPPASQ